MSTNIPPIMPPKRSLKDWLKRLGWMGFVFFLIKGLLWVGAYLVAEYYITK